ncbi:hypothetical protein B0H34DRAFT_662466 [Crassisporium funariophilum]|nr:hypothetical protein B0H34DRAFT_662466 [Crassisporium funariophilum]
MPLEKIPAILLAGLGLQVGLTPPNPAAPKNKQMMGDGPVEMHAATFIAKYAYWVHALIEITIILAATRAPDSALAEQALAFLLPNKSPNNICLSPITFIAMIFMVWGGAIRYLCYREMGRHFTFQVALLENHKLVTSGPYSYVRHPGYTGGVLSYIGMVTWYTAQGSWLRESEIYKSLLAWVLIGPLTLVIFLPLVAIFRRTPTEDKILKDNFGKQWEEWARRVPARLFPGIY